MKFIIYALLAIPVCSFSQKWEECFQDSKSDSKKITFELTASQLKLTFTNYLEKDCKVEDRFEAETLIYRYDRYGKKLMLHLDDYQLTSFMTLNTQLMNESHTCQFADWITNEPVSIGDSCDEYGGYSEEMEIKFDVKENFAIISNGEELEAKFKLVPW